MTWQHGDETPTLWGPAIAHTGYWTRESCGCHNCDGMHKGEFIRYDTVRWEPAHRIVDMSSMPVLENHPTTFYSAMQRLGKGAS